MGDRRSALQKATSDALLESGVAAEGLLFSQLAEVSNPPFCQQRANGYVLMGTRILGIQAKNGSEWLGEWLRRLFGGS